MQPNVDPNAILNAFSTLTGGAVSNIPIPNIPSLNFNAPSSTDIQTQWQNFLTKASQDPDIVNYYNQLLQQAQGDTEIAKNFLEQDYQMGVRQTNDTLNATLQQLGLTSQQEQQKQQDTLNQRGIALTQADPSGSLQYAGGGQSATELGQLNQSQQLRKEAEQRSASQNIERLGLTKQKSETSLGQQLSQTTQGLNQQKQQDIGQRAGTYYGLYQGQQGNNLNQALVNQQSQLQQGSVASYLSPIASTSTVNQYRPGSQIL